MAVARHPRPKELEGVPLEEIMKKYVGRFREKIGDWALLNPLTPIVITMQRAVWGNHILTIQTKSGPKKLPAVPDLSQWWYLRNLAIVVVISFFLLLFACWIFGRLEDNFAENI